MRCGAEQDRLNAKEQPLKRLVIKPPSGERTTVTLVTHRYLDRAEAAQLGCERGTQTVYLGSFPIDLEPRRLDGVDRIRPGDASCGVSVRPNVQLDGAPFELVFDDVQQIRAWLQEHGSWAKQEADLARHRELREQERAAERAQLEAQIRLQLRDELRAEVLTEVHMEMEARRAHPIEDAVVAVAAAGRAVQEEAARLRASGHRIVTRRGPRRSPGQTPALRLLELTVALRKGAFAQFENECKAAGLMGRKPAAGKSKVSGRK